MPSRPDPAGEPLGAMRLLGDSFRLFFAEFGVLFPLALALALIQEAGFVALQPAEGEAAGVVLLSFFGMLSGFPALAIVMLVARDRVEGLRTGLGDHARTVLHALVPMLVLGVAVSLAGGLGLLLLVIPGLYVTARYLVWLPVVVFEGAGMASLGRAEILTRGYRWPLVAALAMFGLLSLGIVMLVSPLMAGAAAGPGTLMISALSALVTAVDYGVFASFLALTYRRLTALDAAGVAAG
jgi:hypothetical protein